MMMTPKIAELRRSVISFGNCKRCNFIARSGAFDDRFANLVELSGAAFQAP
jgi:hypothetical protein